MGANKTQLAWAAGFFDGEGCLQCTKPLHKRFRGELRLSIGQVDPKPLKTFKKLFGGSLIREKKGIYKWQLSGYNNVFPTLKLLLPYLILKQKETAIAIKYQKYYKPLTRGKFTNQHYVMRMLVFNKLKHIKDLRSTTRS